MRSENEQRIIVIVSRGMVQEVSGIPQNTVVEVRDYDVDDADENLGIDEDGQRFVLMGWESEEEE